MNSGDIYSWLLLKAIKGLGEKSIKRLYLKYRDPKLILELDIQELAQVIGQERSQKLKKRELSFDPEKVLYSVEREGILCLSFSDKEYPELLREIEDPPPILFCRGSLKSHPLVAVIGTRRPEYYSVSFTKDVVKQLVELSFGIVSGGAKGIDMLSHKYCAEFGGYTLCVLGMGILRSPKELENLVVKNGALISEFLPEENPNAFTFPRRNRIISGVSKSVFIVEAGIKSGALITAEYANKQKRPVYVHIGVGKSNRWDGCVKLLNEGKAKFFRDVKETLGEFNPFGKEEDEFLSLLVSPKTFEELILLSGLDARELSAKLTTYELSGKIKRLGAYYRLT
ncbi:MAG: DNA-processing protein DprA [Hydrogenobacter sp.]